MTNMEKAVKELQDNLLVIAQIERRQSALRREHSEYIARLDAESAEFERRTKENLAEITDS